MGKPCPEPDRTGSCHIASLVAHCRPEAMPTVIATIETFPGQTVPERDDRGKLVVLIEAPDEPSLLRAIRQVENVPGMISTNLVYHQIDA